MQPDVVMGYPFIDRWRSTGYQYYIIPKEMLRVGKQFGLGLDEVMLYAFLRDRTTLSYKNGWIDAESRVYIICTRDEAAGYIGWSKRKTVTVFANLVESGLLTEIEQRSATNLMKAKRLYVRQWAEPSLLWPAEVLKNGGFPYITKENVLALTGSYYILPRVFFESEALRGLSLRSIFLYIIALDELHMSLSYGKVDKQGLAWCTLKNEEVEEELGCSLRSLTTCYSELERLGLIVRKREGYTPSYRLYLRDYLPPGDPNLSPVAPEPEPPPDGQGEGPCEGESPCTQDLHYGHASSAPRSRKDCTTAAQDLHYGAAMFAPGGTQNLHPNYPSSIHPSLPSLSERSIGAGSANASPAAPEAPCLEKKDYNFFYTVVQKQIDYLAITEDIQLCLPQEKWEPCLSVLDQVVSIMAKDLSTPGIFIRAGEQVLRKEDVVHEYEAIDRYIIFVLVKSLTERLPEVKKPESYIHRALLTAVSEHSGAAYYARNEIEIKRLARDCR